MKARAKALVRRFKGDRYVHGAGVFGQLGLCARAMAGRVSVVSSGFGKSWGSALHGEIREALNGAGVGMAGEIIPGARPNAPREDVLRLADALAAQDAPCVVVVGGGSGIDAVKAAVAYRVFRDVQPDLEAYFGVGKVTRLVEETGRPIIPMLAVQLASGSAAHLTKYANVTDAERGQKLLIVDEALTPPRCLFDYAKSATMPRDFTLDGGLDGVSHCLEVYYGAAPENTAAVEEIALLGIEMIVQNLAAACVHPDDMDAREALGLATDLGGYAIMIGGTNGAHLTSFSLVDILPHGRACALMNPYYTVFFAPAIEEKLRKVGAIYARAGFAEQDLAGLSGRELGMAVATAMTAHARSLGFPTRLEDVAGFTRGHIERALAAAKNPALEMKLQNMPVPLRSSDVDAYMGPVLEAAATGDFSGIRNMA